MDDHQKTRLRRDIGILVELRRKLTELIEGYALRTNGLKLTNCQKNGAMIDIILMLMDGHLNDRFATITDLESRSGIHRASIFRGIEKLETIGMLSRVGDEADRRRTRIFLTEAALRDALAVLNAATGPLSAHETGRHPLTGLGARF